MPSSSKSHTPSQFISMSSLMPLFFVLCTSTFEKPIGTLPKSVLTNLRFLRGPGRVEARMGSTDSLMIVEPATQMLGQRFETMSFRKPDRWVSCIRRCSYERCRSLDHDDAHEVGPSPAGSAPPDAVSISTSDAGAWFAISTLLRCAILNFCIRSSQVKVLDT